MHHTVCAEHFTDNTDCVCFQSKWKPVLFTSQTGLCVCVGVYGSSYKHISS